MVVRVTARLEKETEQLPDTRVQSAPGEKVPLKFAEKCTFPVGTIGDPASSSVTVTVQVVLPPTRNELGEHETETDTDLVTTVTPNGVAVPPVWSKSPA